MSKSRGNVVNPDDMVEGVWRRCVPALRDVHGPAGGQSRGTPKAWKASIVSSAASGGCSWTSRAKRNSSRQKPQPQRRRGAESCWTSSNSVRRSKTSSRRRPAQSAARLHQESHRRPRRPALQHRHLGDDGLRQRSDDLGNEAGFRAADVSPVARPVRAAPGGRTLGQAALNTQRSTLNRP